MKYDIALFLTRNDRNNVKRAIGNWRRILKENILGFLTVIIIVINNWKKNYLGYDRRLRCLTFVHCDWLRCVAISVFIKSWLVVNFYTSLFLFLIIHFVTCSHAWKMNMITSINHLPRINVDLLGHCWIYLRFDDSQT